jgi:hypothetical protein
MTVAESREYAWRPLRDVVGAVMAAIGPKPTNVNGDAPSGGVAGAVQRRQ